MPNSAGKILKKMYQSNCGVTMRTKAESTAILFQRLVQLKLENKEMSQEATFIHYVLKAKGH